MPAVLILFSLLLLASPGQARDGNAGESTHSSAVEPALLQGSELLGKEIPEFRGLSWLNVPPLTASSLRGKVLLVRFWLVDCPYCIHTAPALNRLHERFAGDGLMVVGIHHPKSRRSRSDGYVKQCAEKLGFCFPVANDKTWQTINRLWLCGERRAFTSATLLVDREGVIRWVHPGGEFHQRNDKLDGDHRDCQRSFRELEELIGSLCRGSNRGKL